MFPTLPATAVAFRDVFLGGLNLSHTCFKYTTIDVTVAVVVERRKCCRARQMRISVVTTLPRLRADGHPATFEVQPVELRPFRRPFGIRQVGYVDAVKSIISPGINSRRPTRSETLAVGRAILGVG